MTDTPETVVQRLVRKFGSQTRLGEVCGVGQTAVSQWKGGLIPSHHHRAILDYARANGIDMTAEDLMPAPEIIAAE